MPDVVVVGGGFAGLAAAAQLVADGADVLVLEARPGLGGRAASFRDPETGERVDNGQHVLVGCYHETWRFLDRIGVANAVHRQTSLQIAMIDRAGSISRLVLPPLPSPMHLLSGVLGWSALTMRDRLSLLRIAPALRLGRSKDLGGSKDPPLRKYADDPHADDRYADDRYADDQYADDRYADDRHADDRHADDRYADDRYADDRYADDRYVDDRYADDLPLPVRRGGSLDPPRSLDPPETVRAWLERHGQSARLCELLWEPLAVAALNQSIDRASATYFVAVLSRMFGPESSDAALVLPARPLTEMYATPARDWIEAHGGHVRTNAPATVVIDDGRVQGVRVRDELVPTSAAIVAVPWFALADAFESPPRALDDILANAEATPASPIVTVNLWTDMRALEEPILGLPGRIFQWVFDRGAIVGDVSHLSLISSGADAVVDMTNAEVIACAIEELRGAIPAARQAVIRKASAVRERRATFSLAPGMPPRPSTMTPIRGLFLAGDWIDTGLPATIESAVVSGHRAATCVRSAGL